MKPALVLLLALLLPASASAATMAGPDPQAIDATVRQVVARYRLPGIAVGVIEDGKVVFARGYGETVHGSGDPVTDKTLFKIASNSKAMTAAVLARLVQQGKLQWDDPVVKHLPAFAMHDPWVTAHMTVSDLLVHNSGLPEGGGDLMLWPEPNLFTRDDIVRGLRHIKPAYGFRAGYAYDNLLYVVAGQVAAAAGGASYEELVRRELFAPLGLQGCRVGEFALKDAGSVAQPHGRDGDAIVRTRGDADIVPAIASAPAGGIRCTLDDMLVWANSWLAPTDAQKAWLGDAQRAEMWKARTPMPISPAQAAVGRHPLLRLCLRLPPGRRGRRVDGLAHRHAGRHVFDDDAVAGPPLRLRVHDQRRWRQRAHGAGHRAAQAVHRPGKIPGRGRLCRRAGHAAAGRGAEACLA